MLDIPRVAALAHDHGLPLLVDSTFTTPWLMRPFEHGADLVFHSATKFLSGHGVVIGGVLVDSGAFDWEAEVANGKFPTLTEPYHGFHDMVFTEESTTAAFLLRARREGMRDFGACMAPFTAFQILQGIETLPLRMQRHVDNTRRIVAFLSAHPLVAAVGYPELPGASGSRAREAAAAARLRRRVQLRPQRRRASRAASFIETLKLFSHLANVGDAKSLVIHPASTTHFRMSAEDLAERGHHRRHDPAVDRPRGSRRPDRGPVARAVRRGQGLMRLDVAGHETYAYTGTRPLDRRRPAIVFVHGAANDHSVWALQSRYFAHHGFDTLAVDLSGSRTLGRCARCQRVEAIADWLAQLLDAARHRARRTGRAFARRARRARGCIAIIRSASSASRCSAPRCRWRCRDALLEAARADDPVAYELIVGWSHSAARLLGGNPVPGMWMTGTALRLMERSRTGVLYTDLMACAAYGGGLDAAAAVRCPALVVARRTRPDGADEGAQRR